MYIHHTYEAKKIHVSIDSVFCICVHTMYKSSFKALLFHLVEKRFISASRLMLIGQQWKYPSRKNLSILLYGCVASGSLSHPFPH